MLEGGTEGGCGVASLALLFDFSPGVAAGEGSDEETAKCDKFISKDWVCLQTHQR